MIGYYVHHHGRGHAERAAAISRALDEPVTVLTSSEHAAQDDAFAARVRLGRDDVDADAHSHEAGGALHWAPLAAPGYAERMHRIASWIASAQPRLVVVDVSVEVTVLCRTLGVPVVVVAGAGERPDPAHHLAYSLASMIIAPWPRAVYRPAHLREHDAKTRYVGALSRFDAHEAAPLPGTGSVLVLLGEGGSELGLADVRAARLTTPDVTWTVRGLAGTPWSTDVWADLAAADVVVTHAGQNALAEIAAARRPAVVLPQDRPFGEQRATARALAQHGLATVRTGWPAASDWPQVLESAARTGGQRWSTWNRGDGAKRAAHAIVEVAAGRA